MLAKFIPSSIKIRLADHIQAVAEKPYLPSHPAQDSYCVKVREPEYAPPQELWLGYGETVDEYLDSGKQNVDSMVKILDRAGVSISGRVLEFGCGAGRMLRYIEAERWGVDINAQCIAWCRENLTGNFAVTTTVPHLPFPDNYFDLIFAGSVFTHIEDLQESWLLELARICRGHLYVTIHDEHTVRLMDFRYADHPIAKRMNQNEVFRTNKNGFGMIVIGRGANSQVFYHSEYFQKIVPPVFEWVSHTPEAYYYQSAVLLRKAGVEKVVK